MPQANLHKFQVSYPDSTEYRTLKREIFTQGCYYLEPSKKPGIILDIGGYIGLSSLYFHWLFPTATIQAYEPNPVAFEYLTQNIWQNATAADKVTAFKKAVTAEKVLTTQLFTTPQSAYNASLITKGWDGRMVTTPIEVDAVPLTALIRDGVSILKLDVEGAEMELLQSLQPEHWQKIENLILEFHPGANQNWRDLESLLEKYGFKWTVEQNGVEISKYKGGLVIVKASIY